MSLESLYHIQNKMFTTTTKIDIPNLLIDILIKLQENGYRPYLVGGCVRDFFLNKQIKDFDIEVFNLEFLENIIPLLEKFGNVNCVGKSFGVLKLSTKNFEFDFSLPRTEQKIGKTHKDFIVKTYSKLSFEDAARRRDFTINAISYDYFTNSFIDPFNGINDLKNKKIKHIADKTFVEDSLRVYRAIGFSSRFDFEIDSKTKELCIQIIKNKELEFLPKERIFEELKKIFLKSLNPSIGLKLIDDFELLSINFRNKYKSIDNLANFLRDTDFPDFKKLYLFFATLLKDIDENRILDFLNGITNDKKFISTILLLRRNSTNLNEIFLKNLSLILSLEELILIEKVLEKSDILEVEKLAKKLDVFDKPLEIFVKGKDLINLGFKESIEFKKILNESLILQIEKGLNKEQIIENIIERYKIKSI